MGSPVRLVSGARRLHSARYLAALLPPPGRPAVVLADLRALGVEELRLRRLEGPLELGGVRLARAALVDLHARGFRLEQHPLARRRSQVLGDDVDGCGTEHGATRKKG